MEYNKLETLFPAN